MFCSQVIIKELVMNKDTDLQWCSGRLFVDDGVKISSGGIQNCINKDNGSLEWSNVTYFESDRPFNIFWERAVDMFDTSKGFILNSICHVPSPVFICCERSE
jgi:hypothetical protein